jgi:3-methylfumaryl-CoA hydratase
VAVGEIVEEILVPGPARGLAGLVDVDASEIGDGWLLPPLWHWVYLLDRPPLSDVGRDGHPTHGVPAPPASGLRRMMAGGRVTTVAPLRIGAYARTERRIIRTRDLSGRSGPFTLITVERGIFQGGRLCVLEQQDIAYLSQPPKRTEPTSTPNADSIAAAGGSRWTFPITTTALFCFSALTYNAHRIHYDVDYARSTEGYPNIVVHGPLQALLMSEWARRNHGNPSEEPLGTMSYRLVAPLTVDQGLVVSCARDGGASTTTVSDARGRVTATASIAPPGRHDVTAGAGRSAAD